ncbi:MAG: hypothetical protein V4454_01180 [Pseudomonadota bacterium]
MELLLTREQAGGMLGGVKFQLTAKARLTPEESDAVKKYKMGNTILWEKTNDGPKSDSITSLLAHRFMVARVQVSDLVDGKTIEAKDILEILSAEEQLKKAAEMFHRMLTAAATFGGETVHKFSVE